MLQHLRRIFCTALLVLAFESAALAGDWHRADSHHFTIYSDGSKSDLEDFTHEVEKFDALLRMLWNRPAAENPRKLTIFMVSDGNDVERLLGRDNVVGYYVPTVEGSYAVSNRQQTRNKFALSGKTTLFHEYAHHFFFNNFSIPAPPWFVEGFAEFVSTAEFRKNGDWYFGKPAHHRAGEIQYFGRIDVRDLLTKRPHEIDGSSRNAFYGWSWLLTHLLYSEDRDRGVQIGRYLALLNSGAEPLAAAEGAFGDLDRLDRDLRDYANGRMGYSKSDKPLTYFDDIAVASLSESDGAIVELRMKRLGSGQFDEALQELRALGSGDDAPAELLYQLGRAEYSQARKEADEAEDDSGLPDFSAAEAAFRRALERDPDHLYANVFTAKIKIERLAESDDAEDADWDAARKLILAANRTDPYNPFPLYHYALSFGRQGKRDPQIAAAYETAFALAPEAVNVRVAYAQELAFGGEFDRAIRLVSILANDPHRGNYGQAVLRRIEAMRDGRSIVALPMAELDDADAEEPGDDEN